MTYSMISHLSCPKCKETYPSNTIQQLCKCGSPLLVDYKLEEVKKRVTKEELKSRPYSLWRYHELLPVEHEEHVISFEEGMTPLSKLPFLGKQMGISNLYIKDEGLVPTGSFKARGASVGISKAKELGVKHLAMPTNGNAGAAWSLYAAKAQIEAYIVMPEDAPEITRKEVSISGAHLFLVNGLISDAGKIVADLVKEQGFYDASTLKEPYRIEGKKTMGYEIAEQMNWELPDVILYPTGGGVGLIGIYKALLELQQLDWISGKLPRLVAVQSEGCAPIVRAYQEGETESEFWEDSKTHAFGINVPKAIGDFLVLDAIYQTEGCAVAVSEDEIREAQRDVAKEEGQFICPEGAATFAAAKHLRESNWIHDSDRVVCLNTGLGIKYPDAFEVEAPLLEPYERVSFSQKNWL
ncbi:threonine synthase [Guptibacillus hwajinpoensis]|uniref:Threonine synthase n=1 Tax=Guptibacillus hwajinpoensis TaxID=208199 RepID=A0ABU0K302_9BACL|nr:threonine synthase [Alkalihalobacillus hemicentroti]MDQ0483674.1 threonine synthase [Alkalihalobacillus hemicentroti]